MAASDSLHFHVSSNAVAPPFRGTQGNPKFKNHLRERSPYRPRVPNERSDSRPRTAKAARVEVGRRARSARGERRVRVVGEQSDKAHKDELSLDTRFRGHKIGDLAFPSRDLRELLQKSGVSTRWSGRALRGEANHETRKQVQPLDDDLRTLKTSSRGLTGADRAKVEASEQHKIYSATHQWLKHFEDERESFGSYSVFCQMKLRQAMLLTSSWDVPNKFRTAVVCTLLERAKGIFGRYNTIMGILIPEVLQSVYCSHGGLPSDGGQDLQKYLGDTFVPWHERYREILTHCKALEAEVAGLKEEQVAMVESLKRAKLVDAARLVRATLRKNLAKRRSMRKNAEIERLRDAAGSGLSMDTEQHILKLYAEIKTSEEKVKVLGSALKKTEDKASVATFLESAIMTLSKEARINLLRRLGPKLSVAERKAVGMDSGMAFKVKLAKLLEMEQVEDFGSEECISERKRGESTITSIADVLSNASLLRRVKELMAGKDSLIKERRFLRKMRKLLRAAKEMRDVPGRRQEVGQVLGKSAQASVSNARAYNLGKQLERRASRLILQRAREGHTRLSMKACSLKEKILRKHTKHANAPMASDENRHGADSMPHESDVSFTNVTSEMLLENLAQSGSAVEFVGAKRLTSNARANSEVVFEREVEAATSKSGGVSATVSLLEVDREIIESEAKEVADAIHQSLADFSALEHSYGKVEAQCAEYEKIILQLSVHMWQLLVGSLSMRERLQAREMHLLEQRALAKQKVTIEKGKMHSRRQGLAKMLARHRLDNKRSHTVRHTEAEIGHIIAQIYEGKILQDSVDDREKRSRQTLPHYLRDHFIRKYGLKSLALDHMHVLDISVRKFAKRNRRCHMFAVLVGSKETNAFVDIKQASDMYLLALMTIFDVGDIGAVGGRSLSIQEQMGRGSSSQHHKAFVTWEKARDTLDVIFRGHGGEVWAKELLEEVQSAKAGNMELDLFLEKLMSVWFRSHDEEVKMLTSLFNKHTAKTKTVAMDYAGFKVLVHEVSDVSSLTKS